MKPKNVKRRLQSRIRDWEKISGEAGSTAKLKIVHKPCGAVLTFTKPGSFNK